MNSNNFIYSYHLHASLGVIANEYGMTKGVLWEWFHQGTRLILLSAGGMSCFKSVSGILANVDSIGTLYICLIIAALGMKNSLLQRYHSSADVIISLANILRNPSGKHICI